MILSSAINEVAIDVSESVSSQGFHIVPELLDEAEMSKVTAEAEAALAEEGPHTVTESDGSTVRGVHGITRPLFEHLVRLPRLLEVAQRCLGGPVYVHQFKINAKAGLTGERWEWHQDFRFWRDEDGMPKPRALSVALFLDPADHFNGPLLFVPESHKLGLVHAAERDADGWEDDLSADLKFTVPRDTLKNAIADHPIEAATGKPGDVLFFDSQVLHGSAGSMSPDDRRMLIIAYNRVDNALREVDEPRPGWLASRNYSPLEAGDDGAIASHR